MPNGNGNRSQEVVVVTGASAGLGRAIVERFAREAALAREEASGGGAIPSGEAACALLEPLSDDEGQLEVLTPISVQRSVPHGLTIRRLPAAPVAAVTTEAAPSHAAEFTAALDAIFDWFDRHGHAALGAPSVTLQATDLGWRTRVLWTFNSRP